MPGLQEKLAALVSSFADDVIAALRRAPLDEVMALTGNRSRLEAAPEPARTKQRRAPSAAPRPKEAAARPKEAAARPKEAAARPKEAAAHPKEAAARPKERAARPKEAAAPVVDISPLIGAAERVFAERGSRGATALQLQDALAAEGLSPAEAAGDVIRLLVEREIIRDAGFRRTTGQGTAPVFVSCR